MGVETLPVKHQRWNFNPLALLKAMMLATVAHCRLAPLRSPVFIAKAAIAVLAAALKPRVDDQTYRAREDVCVICPFYNPRLQTCGTPGQTFINPKTKRAEPLGCWCHMPTKARFKVNCWLSLKTNGKEGWPKEMNAEVGEVAVPDSTKTSGVRPPLSLD